MLRSRAMSAVVLAAWLVMNGCTTLREIPRADFATRSERKGVRVETRDGLVYEFDYATFDPDSLTGYRNRADAEGPADQVAMHKVALDDVSRLTTRKVDWYRTGLVGGGVIAGVIAVGLQQAAKNGGDSGGGGGGPRPCAPCSASPGNGH